ncbi:uncharacterized protein L969DRAFT_90112 [Mixia osmundae IAM 14324]|uniref:Sphingolipid long chain base-responsive protein LSP1 n=1 Tax=Mixia osmundae (strain CBS 9802 / IAM 14324 / JCM 22182 / KY 12970) TaxID=764103 RepID=G7EB08_MIXOS|nr:uncharacterized protein L969DRAFT_90112 [Mixia osmundae IAM 14324]KEI37053.1 hypothetical protein L969DRAFT_90112 [Mixia osmundae IAM 14324]GAB00019.1 hypothetical protein E5Q_06721 [Mixia osmundae IAM 14324]
MTEEPISGLSKFFSSAREQGGQFARSLPAVDQLRHDLRSTVLTHSPNQSAHTLKLALLIAAQKGTVIDHLAVARETKAVAKALFDWSNEQTKDSATDLRDVSDRLAYVVFQEAELHAEYAAHLEQSRTLLKELRNFENKFSPNRDRRSQLQHQIAKLKTSAKPNGTASLKRQASLQDELDTLEKADVPHEKSIEMLKRQKLRESFDLRFTALQRLGEKMAVLSSYGRALGADLTSNDPDVVPYAGKDRTAAIRVNAQEALDAWSPSTSFVPPPRLEAKPGISLQEGYTYASFGQTHKDDLAAMSSSEATLPEAGTSAQAKQGDGTLTSMLNMAPSPLSPAPPPEKVPRRGSLSATATVAPTDEPESPTMAETGTPIVGGNGPVSGQLTNRRLSRGESVRTSTDGLPPYEATHRS